MLHAPMEMQVVDAAAALWRQGVHEGQQPLNEALRLERFLDTDKWRTRSRCVVPGCPCQHPDTSAAWEFFTRLLLGCRQRRRRFEGGRLMMQGTNQARKSFVKIRRTIPVVPRF